MSLAYDLVISAVIAVVSTIIMVIGIYLFAQDAPLHVMASAGTENVNGAERADLYYKIMVWWVPAGGYATAVLWPIVRVFRRQATTASLPPPP